MRVVFVLVTLAAFVGAVALGLHDHPVAALVLVAVTAGASYSAMHGPRALFTREAWRP